MSREKGRPDQTIALRYRPNQDEAPVVVAKGSGLVARRIREIAEESGIPIHRDQQLTDYLMALDLYQEIPPEVYPVVAEILAFIYRMNRSYPGGEQG